MCVWTGEERERKGPAEKKVEKVGGARRKRRRRRNAASLSPPLKVFPL